MRKGQSTLEFAMLLLVVVAVFISMSAYLRRSVGANLYYMEQQANNPGQAAGGGGGGGDGGGGGGDGGGGGGGPIGPLPN